MTQKQLAQLAKMAQPRISKMERPGEESFNIDTLIRLAAAFKLGLKVEFVPFSKMLAWENSYSQDVFDPAPIDQDIAFLNPIVSAPPVVVIGWGNTSVGQFYRPQGASTRLGNVLTGVISDSSMAGINVVEPEVTTYVGTYSAGLPSREIQAIPSLPYHDLAVIRPASELAQ